MPTDPSNEPPGAYPKVHALRDIMSFRTRLAELAIDLPAADTMLSPEQSPLARPITAGDVTIGNRFAIQPMEGWDGTLDGRPTDDMLRRWRRFGESGAKLIWGGEAYAVRPDGRANPNQLCYGSHAVEDLTLLRQSLADAHVASHGSADGLVVGLQLTHSGRFCRPNGTTLEPRVAYAHPLLNRKFGLPMDYPVLSDGEIADIIAAYHAAAVAAREAGFDFVDVKHCHGYLGHEILSAFTRPGRYGGSFENRTRFLREIVAGIRSAAPGLAIAVRLSAFDFLPYKPDPATSAPGKPGRGIPDDPVLRPYVYAFGVDQQNPADRYDLAEPILFLEMLRNLGITLVNITAGSPYYNPHIQRPAYYPPSDGYRPPEDPLIGCARQIAVVAELKSRFPSLVFVGTAYTYLQEFLPNVAQAAVANGMVDIVGLGRMVLSYPTLPADILAGGPLTRPKHICRTFSDCTTAPRNGLPSGCYPLDEHYKIKPDRKQLLAVKKETV